MAVVALVAVGILVGTREEEPTALKPVVYLYPERTTTVTVGLTAHGGVSFAYPALRDGRWQVDAEPDGTLTDARGRQYPSLFWEGPSALVPDMSTGSVVRAEAVVPFLERTLAELGLTDREAAEFITFWAPRLSAEPVVLIHFDTEAAVEALAELDVDPVPDSVIRVFMSYRPVEDPDAVQVRPQTFTTPDRHGFVLVEWGGQQLP
ncbi:hypothetical protein HGA03_11380 [Cellulomonas denverensis]|uniref:Uncharacterized protein n=1 Tax=Cellulomonas denverensis TaxID=264297 RepID=A0A7X6KWE6_9CELL|nr:hypothetical protein [Cellulomonas denverensis]